MSEPVAFEPTRSFAYHFVRYTLLPEIVDQVKALGDEPFLLRDLARPLIDKYISKEQQNTLVKKAQSDRQDKMVNILRFYIYFLGKGPNMFKPLGKGLFCARSEEDVSDDELEEAALESGDEEASDTGGWIYAFSFPAIAKGTGDIPIKIGMTIRDVEARVMDQAKGSAAFEQPVVLGKWQVKRVGPTELAIHNSLKARGKWRENAPGREWFDTTVQEVESIVKFIGG